MPRGNPRPGGHKLTAEDRSKGAVATNAIATQRKLERIAFEQAFQEAASKLGADAEELRVRIVGKLIECAMKGQNWALLRVIDHLFGQPKQTVELEGTVSVVPAAPTTVLTPEQARRVAAALRDEPSRN